MLTWWCYGEMYSTIGCRGYNKCKAVAPKACWDAFQGPSKLPCSFLGSRLIDMAGASSFSRPSLCFCVFGSQYEHYTVCLSQSDRSVRSKCRLLFNANPFSPRQTAAALRAFAPFCSTQGKDKTQILVRDRGWASNKTRMVKVSRFTVWKRQAKINWPPHGLCAT